MSDKKKVYVETTVISDATSLPARDLAQSCPCICTPQMLQEGGEV